MQYLYLWARLSKQEHFDCWPAVIDTLPRESFAFLKALQIAVKKCNDSMLHLHSSNFDNNLSKTHAFEYKEERTAYLLDPNLDR